MSKYSILVIDDDNDVLVTTEVLLENEGYKCFTANHPSDIGKITKKHKINTILLDMNYVKGYTDGKEGMQWISELNKKFPEIPIIPITAFADLELAVKAVKNGAHDFIQKPWNNSKLLCTVSSAIKLNEALIEKKEVTSIQNQLKKELSNSEEVLIGESNIIIDLKENIKKVANSDANVLITGESGTGKEIAARLTHKQSAQKDEIFYKIDLASIQPNLFESELFGYEEGAFTDAKSSKAGKLEIANNGTLFLDEISSLNLQQQSKILSVLQNRKVSRLGSVKETNLNFRLICSTNKNIPELISAGLFREDLFYRINTFELKIPDLVTRLDDIELIAQYYLKLFSKKYNKPKLKLNSKIINKLKKHNWPGNIRELTNVLERAVILSDGGTLDIGPIINSDSIINSKNVSLNLAETEKQWILKAIEKHNGNMTKAAKELGLKRSSFYRRLDKYGIK